MDKLHLQDDPSRRDFLKDLTTLPLLAMLQARLSPAGPVSAFSTRTATAPAVGKGDKKFVAIQIGGRSLLDEGVEKVLDTSWIRRILPATRGGVGIFRTIVNSTPHMLRRVLWIQHIRCRFSQVVLALFWRCY